MPDINPILGAIQDFTTEASKASGDIGAYAGKVQDAFADHILNTGSIATNDQIIQQASDASKLHVQQMNQDASAAFGANPDAVGYVMNKLGARAIDANQRMNDAMDKITAVKSLSFFDNPIDWLVGHATLNGTIDEYNTAEADFNSTTKAAADLNTAAQAANKTNQDLAQPITAATIAASSANIAAKAKQQADVTAVQAATAGIQGMQAALSADRDALNASVEGTKLVFQNNADARAEKMLQMEQERFRLAKADKEGEEAFLNYVGEAVNRGMALAGKSNFLDTNNKLNKEIFKAIRDGKSGINQEYLEYYRAGMSNDFGPSPARALASVTALNPNVPAPMQTTINWLKSVAGNITAQETMGTPGMSAADKAGLTAKAVNAHATAELASEDANVRQDSIRYPGSLKTIVATAEQHNPELLASNPQLANLYSKVLKPGMEAGLEFADPADVYKAVRSAVNSGTIGINDAAELATLYKYGVNLNNTARGFDKLGIPPATTYNTKVPSGVLGSNKIDVLNPTQWTREVMRFAPGGTLDPAKNMKYNTDLTNPFAGVGIGLIDAAANIPTTFGPELTFPGKEGPGNYYYDRRKSGDK